MLKSKLFEASLEGWLIRNSSCSDWLGYTLKGKLANRKNPLPLEKAA